MNHPDWPALMSGILADPDDDTVRLVAADFLEENGDPDRAAFIRVQCALAVAQELGDSFRANELRKKERAFLGPLSTFHLFWALDACPELVRMGAQMHIEGAERLRWRRGFVEGVACPAGEWLRHGTAVRVRQPISYVHLTACQSSTRDEWYASLDSLRGLRNIVVDASWWHDATYEGWLKRWLPDVRIDPAPL